MTELDVWDLSTAQSREAKTNVGNTCEHIGARPREQCVTGTINHGQTKSGEREEGIVACLGRERRPGWRRSWMKQRTEGEHMTDKFMST